MMRGAFLKASGLLRIAALLLMTTACYRSARGQPAVEVEQAPELFAERTRLRKFWALSDIGEALQRNELESAIATAVHHGLQLGKSDNDDEDRDFDVTEPRLRLAHADAVAVFNKFFLYNAGFNFEDGARQNLKTILWQRISFINRMCGLSQKQKEKLRLAGTGDMERLFDQVESQRQKFVKMVAGESDGSALGAVIRETNTLRNPLNSGSLQNNSMFANVLRNSLTPEQITKYNVRRMRLSPALRKTVPQISQISKDPFDAIRLHP